MEKADRFLSRRKLLFVLGGVATAAGAAMLTPFRNALIRNARELVASRQPILRRMFVSLANASYEAWLDQVGTTFSVGGGTSLKLAGVEAFAARGARPFLPRNRAFLAVFDVLDGQTMAGDLIYTASHPQFGPFPIFLSASTDPRTPARMTAVFN